MASECLGGNGVMASECLGVMANMHCNIITVSTNRLHEMSRHTACSQTSPVRFASTTPLSSSLDCGENAAGEVVIVKPADDIDPDVTSKMNVLVAFDLSQAFPHRFCSLH